MPMQRDRYPANWHAISLRIRNREGWACKFCQAEAGKPNPITGSNVVLTVAHLDHDTTNNADANLAALCQRCHLSYDSIQHMQNSAATRRRRRTDMGQLEITKWT